MDGTRTAAIYARSAAENQESIDDQLETARAYGAANGLEIVAEFIDNGASGNDPDRKGLVSMINLVRSGEVGFRVVIVDDLSRLACDCVESMKLRTILESYGVELLSVKNPIADSPEGKFLRGLIEIIDAYIPERLSDNIARGMAENARRGFRNGGVPPIGYVPVIIGRAGRKGITLQLDETWAPIVKEAFRMSESGSSPADITKALNENEICKRNGKTWSVGSVRRLLSNETYIGVLSWGRKRSGSIHRNEIRVELAHVPIIDEECFRAVQVSLRPMRCEKEQATHTEEEETPSCAD